MLHYGKLLREAAGPGRDNIKYRNAPGLVQPQDRSAVFAVWVCTHTYTHSNWRVMVQKQCPTGRNRMAMHVAGIMVCTPTWMRPRARGPFWAAKAALRAKHGRQQRTQHA